MVNIAHRGAVGVAGGLAAVVAGVIGLAVVQGSGATSATGSCASPYREANQLIQDGDAAAGAALPLQGTDMDAFRAASRAAAETQLRGLKLEAANRDCFSKSEQEGLDQRIAHLEHLLKK